MAYRYENAKDKVGGIFHIGREDLTRDDFIAEVRRKLEERGVLVFPQLHASDAEQLAFTDKLGERVNFTRKVPGSDASMQDVYKITLDKTLNTERDYVLGTFFWHIDGATIDQALPKATVLSARALSAEGGATEFSNLYAAYDDLPEAEKAELADLRVIHTVEAAVRPVNGIVSPERLQRYRNLAAQMDQPLIWTHEDGRKSLMIGTHADGIVGMPGPHGRALITRLLQWASQPQYVYRHDWTPGDLVIWNNQGVMHRVVPYTDEARVMHRTTIAGGEKPGHVARDEDVEAIYVMP